MSAQGTVIEPFWNRMPRFFLYAAKGPAIFIAIGIAVVLSAGFDWQALARAAAMGAQTQDPRAIDVGPIFLPAVVAIVAFIFVLKYGYDILLHTAHGYLSPPKLDADTLGGGYELPFKHGAALVVLGVASAAIARLAPPLAPAFSIAVIVVQPAITMTLAIERSLVSAINPMDLGRIAGRIGWPYLAIFGLWLLLQSAPGTAVWLGVQALPIATTGQVFIWGLAQSFFFFVAMHLMGYLVFQYHDRVGFEPETLAEAEEDDEWKPILAPLNAELDEGRYADAADRLWTLIREHPDYSIWLRQKRHKALKLTHKERDFIDNAGKLLGELIDANRLRDATEIYIDLTDYDPKLRPARERDYEPLMEMLVQRGEYRRAVQMANGFHRDFPDSSSVPPLYLEVARIFFEYLDQPDKARQVADFLVKRYPNHPAAKRARAIRDAVAS
jgi:outer membrane protein assembly factor BamD (BamD/ComL family)